MIRRIEAIGGVLLVLFLAGCSGMGPAPGDGPGRVIDNPQAIPDAIPRNAPPSRYGNPDTYEVFGETYRVMRTADGHRERGIASWYGSKFHGRRTSSGEPYDMYTMTAAHRSLPLPTWVEVRHLGNDRRIVVKVNDRGPFADNRIIDLSYAAAAKLGMLGTGTAPVEIRTVTPEENEESVVEVANTTAPSETAPSDDSAYWLQVAAFGERRNAERLIRELEASGIHHPARIEAGDDGLHRVRLGPLDNAKAVDDASRSLKTANFDPGHVIIPD